MATIAIEAITAAITNARFEAGVEAEAGLVIVFVRGYGAGRKWPHMTGNALCRRAWTDAGSMYRPGEFRAGMVHPGDQTSLLAHSGRGRRRGRALHPSDPRRRETAYFGACPIS
jgi:hypothetical protein